MSGADSTGHGLARSDAVVLGERVSHHEPFEALAAGMAHNGYVEGEDQTARRGRARRILKLTAIALGITAAGSLIVAGMVGSAAGCGSVDPTDPSNYSTAEITNDTTDSVVIGDCHGSYCGPQTSATLTRNSKVAVNGACGVTGRNMTSWRVSHPDGHLVGYIAIDTPRSTRDLTFHITRVSPDRLTPTKPG